MTDAERIAALEAENAALRAELEHWRELSKSWVKPDARSFTVGSVKPREVISEPVPWPKGTIVTEAPAPRGICDRCKAALERGETAVCGCVTSGPVICS